MTFLLGRPLILRRGVACFAKPTPR